MTLFIPIYRREPEGDKGEYQFVLLELLSEIFLVFYVNFREGHFIVIDKAVRRWKSIHQLVCAKFLPHFNGLVLELDDLIDKIIEFISLLLVYKCILYQYFSGF